ncbi:hypothetical protein [Neokomagataea thailandica]|uniref:Phage tail protein n=1 Tax=Neokomagataea tanensis NBRC 106556 TaxID=1223519 RepID=A0ABQ0QGU4_9PROT|nr:MULTISPECIES: hypothetical protein [Neokomagataea]GBR44229.1 phage tail protein [Neokomagataea tanensis NBRC 106556]
MISFGHVYGDDLSVLAGNVSFVSREEATKQRILRRILTNSGGYIWHPDYGAGLPQMVGSVVDEELISASIRHSLLSDVGVDSSRPIEVNIVQSSGGGVLCWVEYFDESNGKLQSLKAEF